MDIPMEITTRGDVEARAKDDARDMIDRVIASIGDPVLFARVKLTLEPDPARARPAIAQALLDVDGSPVRAHIAASDVTAAVHALEQRLRDQLQHRAEHRRTLRHRGPQSRRPHEWRHGDAPTRRPEHFDRPPEEREVVRRKTFGLHELSPAEAADEMDRLDYDFHLFVCADTGSPCVIARGGDGQLSLASPQPPPSLPEWLKVDATPVPTLDEAEAITHLDLTGADHVFYLDATTGAGIVVYRRYDGHYGEITSEGVAGGSDPDAASGERNDAG